jgi:nucleoside triphosphate pyrophosphatase
LLGKPADRDEARTMLSILRGRDHLVITGFVLLNEAGETLHVQAVVSTVTMRAFSPDELGAYIATDEPYDKAGAYALQGLGGKLVEKVDGCRNTVIGLPVCRVRVALASAGVDLLPYPEGGYCDYCPLMQVGRG